MKKIAVFLDNASNDGVYGRISGLLQRIYEEELDIGVYLYRSRGALGFDRTYNVGEYNIFRLPEMEKFDGFVLIFNDLNRENEVGWRACMETIERVKATGKPAISIGTRIEGMYHVGIDNITSMTALMRHLVELHRCRSFWFLMGPRSHRESQERAQAIRDYLAGWDDTDYSEYFFYESFRPSCGAHGFRELYRRYGKLPDAVVCANDSIAVGVCMEAAKRGLRCPRDFLLTGFDNVDLASCYSPTLTTIDQRWSELGRVCIDCMQAVWAGEEFPESTMVYTQMYKRQSCGCEQGTPEDVSELFNERIHRSIELDSFNRRLVRLENDLMVASSLREQGEVFAPMLSYLRCEKLYLILDRRFYSEREQTQLLMDGVRSRREAEGFFLTEGYPPQMMIAFSCNEKGVIMTDEPIEWLVWEDDARGGPKDHMFLPLHFGERTVGFLAISHTEHLIRNNYLTRAIQMLLAAVENFYIRDRLRGANELLARASITDVLTGFYNRMGYQEKVGPCFRKCHEAGRGIAILFADMDGMKQINDKYGHDAGDLAIQAIAQGIQRACPKDAITARMGGDEFLVVVEEDDPDRVQEMVSAIRREVPHTEAAAKLPYPPEVSVGSIITDPAKDLSLEDYVRMSDELMYEEKRIRKGGDVR